jgi:hypothetical protein
MFTPAGESIKVHQVQWPGHRMGAEQAADLPQHRLQFSPVHLS